MNSNLYRAYTKDKDNTTIRHDSIFGLLGSTEPAQTKGLGYVFARSPKVTEDFLRLIGKDKKEINYLLSEKYIVDCEYILNDSCRADIIISFPNTEDNYTILIEAKSISENIKQDVAEPQIEDYLNADFFEGKNVTVVTLTANTTLCGSSENIINIRWSDIVDMLYDILNKNKNNSDAELCLIEDYFNYLSKIQKFMNYYDIDVLSIPAGQTIEIVKETSIYECPSTGKGYKSRGEHHPLYMAFRGTQGRIEKLYKIEDVIVLDPSNETDVEKSGRKDKIEEYKEARKTLPKEEDRILEGEKYFFFINKEESITLPYPIIYEANNSYVETNRKLYEYFAKPTEINGEKVVLFTKK